ncbi:hypothetical protein QJS04_geneDACA022091 [Acorus gramineus]|uniref:Squalene monooxygenase n=1 Tax=Acorus gramineus TaxID=55184 RepID=A0AAV9AZZ5_ACOGR|nr:hypothetical protein QJS04_geneDACA022091 [Acorus gramineus]
MQVLYGAVAGSLMVGFLGFCYVLASSKREAKRASGGDARSEAVVDGSVDGRPRSVDDGATDVIVVGAGVAGAAIAYTLGKIVWRKLMPRGCLDMLSSRMGGTRSSDVSGRSFHNGRFIQRMREKAVSLPNVKLEQGTVTSLLEENGTVKGVAYRVKSGAEFKACAPLTVVCDGCFSNLRKSLCYLNVDVPSYFVGLVLKNCELPYPNHGHVILANPSPILFYPISSTEVRCLVDVPGPKLPSMANGEMANYLKTVVAPQPVASTINTLAGALYKVFCASSDEARNEMREACFDYLSLGGVFSNGPVALLSGLNPRPLSLVMHFFAVAIYGVGRLLLPFPSPKRLWIGARLISGASSIIFPIIKAEGVRQMFFPATVPAYYRAPPTK